MTPTPHDLFNQALQLASRFSENFVDLGRTLRQLKDQDADLFARVLAERKIHPRKAYYLVEIDRCISELDISRERLASIGWTKIQLVVDHLTPESFEQYLDLAEKHTVDQIKMVLKGGAPSMTPKRITFTLYPRQYRSLVRALLAEGAFRKGATIIGKDIALMKIVAKSVWGKR